MKFTGFQLAYALLSLDKSGNRSLVAQKRKQNRNLKKVIKRAYQIPFYREKFDAVGLKPSDICSAEDLCKFPVISKQELKEWMAKILETEGEKKDFVIKKTSGSSGSPTAIVYTQFEEIMIKANWMRVWIKSGYNPMFGKTMTRIDAHDPLKGRQYDSIVQKLGLFRKKAIDQFAPETVLIDEINQYKPDMICINKSHLLRVAIYCIDHNVELHKPKFYIPIGEMIDDNSKRIFRQIFGEGLIDAYGCSEVGNCMYKLMNSDAYMVHNDSYVVNIIDENGKMSDSGRLILTSLIKRTIPIINYEIGDIASSYEREGIRFVRSIEGRMNDYLLGEDNKKYYYDQFQSVVNECDDIMQIRFEQDEIGKVSVKIVRNPESTKECFEIEQHFADEINNKLNSNISFSFVWMSKIPVDSNGKIRMIQNNVK